jgi:hypothetical protein
MPEPERPARTPPVIFGTAAWAEDVLRASEAARAGYERDGVAVADLRACQAEGPARTRLEHCVKVYLPPPAGQHGMVFRIVRDGKGRLGLTYVAFGLRHPAQHMRSRRCTRSHTDGCIWRRRAEQLRLQDLAVLREHPRTTHRPATRVRQFPDVGSAGHIRVAMAEEGAISSTLSSASRARLATVWRKLCIDGSSP